MSAALADPNAARAHARAMAGTVVEAMPILPPRADDLPTGVAPDDLLWEETIAAGGYASRRSRTGHATAADRPRGRRLRVAAAVQRRHADRAAQHRRYRQGAMERLSVGGQPAAVGHGPRPRQHRAGRCRHARRLLRGFQRSVQRGANMATAATAAPIPTRATGSLLGAAKHGLGRRDVHPCINLFKGVRIAADGAIVRRRLGPFAPGRALILRAEMDVIVVLANCPHVLDPRRPWRVTPLRATAWRGPVTAADDPIRNATPERPARLPQHRRSVSPLMDPMTDPHFAGLAGHVVHDEIVPARAPWMHRVRAGRNAAHHRPRRQPGGRFPALRRRRRCRALQRAGHGRGAGQHLPAHRHRAAVQRGPADDDDHRHIGRVSRHDRRRMLVRVQHAALRSSHQGPAQPASRISSKPICATAAASATWSRTSTSS